MIVGIIVPGIGEGVGTIFIWILLGKPRRPVFNTGRRVVDPVPSERVIPLITDPEFYDIHSSFLVEDINNDVVIVHLLVEGKERGWWICLLAILNSRLEFETRLHEEVAIGVFFDPGIGAVSVVTPKATDEWSLAAAVVVRPLIHPHIYVIVSTEEFGVEVVIVECASVCPCPIHADSSESDPQRHRWSI